MALRSGADPGGGLSGESDVKLYKFICGGRVAVSNDQAGASLPASKKPWVHNGSINVKSSDQPRVGASPKDILDGIRNDGYFVWPAKRT